MSLDELNLEVNSSIIYQTDLEQYGKYDVWTIPKLYGDCEDYALLKRKLLKDKKYRVIFIDNKN